jgi:hypothetical protein
MNEQIKQLMLEARLGPALLLHHWGKIDALTDSEQAELERLEKFAELIVRECALVAKTLPHTPERHWVQDSVTYIPVHCEQNILKHFGVEE